MAITKQDLIGQTIDDLAGRYRIDVKLGAKDGSGFVFCGDLSDIDTAELDYMIVTSYRKAIKEHTAFIERERGRDSTYESFIRGARIKARKLGIDEDTSPEAYKKWLLQRDRAIKKRIEARTRVKKKLTKFTSISTRKIVDVYKSISEIDTIILLYEGTETGRWWTTEEFQTGIIDYD